MGMMGFSGFENMLGILHIACCRAGAEPFAGFTRGTLGVVDADGVGRIDSGGFPTL